MTASSCTRREFARLLVAGGVGIAFVGCGRRASERKALTPQWWIELHDDGRIRMLTTKVEMGQGAHTGLRTLLAEELDVEPARIEIVQVPSDPRYGSIITGGSYTVAGWHERMRRAGATARHMLLLSAARSWQVAASELATADGTISHEPSGRQAAYADFVSLAAELPAPGEDSISLKPQAAWRYIGKPAAVAHHGSLVVGEARYGIDLHVPGMCHAVLARAPTLGARLDTFDDRACRSTPGFIASVVLRGNEWPSQDHCRDAIAIVAADCWSALRAREALEVSWHESAVHPDPMQELQTLCSRPGIVCHERRQADAPAIEHTITAEFHHPYVAHVPMEPPNATASFDGERMEVWCGNQRQTRLKDAIVRELGMPADRVTVHGSLIGGSFGRRLEVDYGLEAAKLAQHLRRPVQILWTREDDLRFGLYRSASVHHLSAGIGADKRITMFRHRMAAESVLRQQEPAQLDTRGADWTLAAPLVSLLYDIPDVRIEQHPAQPMVPCAWWRGTYWNNVTAAVECFIDEVAQSCDEDPLSFRLRHLHAVPQVFEVDADTRVTFDPARMRRVLQAAAEHADWSAPIPAGHARGLACGIYDAPECHAAVIVEMSMIDDSPVLSRVTVAVDVGIAINPQIVRAQAIGGFVMGASAALHERIDWSRGQVTQRSFADYPLLRMHECPVIDVVIVPSSAGVCGVGEIVTPAAIAAVSNAMSRLRGSRVRSWPVRQAIDPGHPRRGG